MSEEKLLPCPFCGVDAGVDTYGEGEDERFQLGCVNLRCPVKPYIWNEIPEINNAEDQWNTRA